MKKLIGLFLAVTMLFSMNAALADDDEADITVQGSAVITASPDVVTVTANVSLTADTVSAAQEAVNVVVEATIEKLLALGVLADDIVTESYNCYPSYNYDTGTAVIAGYQANHTLSITMKDITMLDSVITAVTDSGMNEIYNVSYDVSTRSKLYQDALALAISAAEEKAVKMAAAGGMTITGIESIAENGSYDSGYSNVSMETDAKASAAGVRSTGIRSGSVSVTAKVTVVYEAKK